MNKSDAYSQKFAIVLLWGPMVVFGVSAAFLAVFGMQFFEWLFEIQPLNIAKLIVLVFFSVLSGWLILNSVWLCILGLKTIVLKKYPPGNLPIPLRHKKLVVGSDALRFGFILLGVAFISLFFGAAFAYAQYISSSSSL